MKRIVLVGIIALVGCRSAAPIVDSPAAAPPDAFSVVEASLVAGEHVERMHRDATGYVALVAGADGAYRLVRLQQQGAGWAMVETTASEADYLWPAQ